MIRGTIKWGFGLLGRHVGLRFFVAGGIAGVIDLVGLYVLNTTLGIYYLLSAIIAFILSFIVSFTLHKFWTFKSHGEETDKQVVLYFGSSMFGLFLNTLLMYIFVDHFHLQVILSQVIVGLLVAGVSFSISRKFVFKYQSKSKV